MTAQKRRGDKRNNPATWTDAFIKALKPEQKPYKLAEGDTKGEGRLVVRVLPTGAKEFFYRYRAAGQDKTVSVGRYDATGNNGRTLAGIRAKLRTIRETQRATGDVKGHLEAEARRKEIESRKGTLGQLLGAYVESLKAAGKPSHKEAAGIFRRNVHEPFTALWNTKAAEIGPEDIQRILARMVKAGIGRQVNITRAYLRAAFGFGGKADHDPRTIASDGVLFGLKINPVALVPTIQEFERTGDRVLGDDELRAYWNALEALPAVQRATLRLNLALACQRSSQLIRADWGAFDLENKTLLLRDTKGRGGSRDHLLPLTPFALEQLKPLRELNSTANDDGKLPPPFSSDGKRPMVLTTLSHAVNDISAKLAKQGIPSFQARDLRRTAETMLQQLGVEKEVRAHLLSHGRSQGVQGRHYERYDFLPEKRAALEKWARHLQRIIEGKTAKVVAIKGAA